MRPLLAWLGTYLIHSTALLAAALLIGRFLRRRALPAEETVLRLALVASLATASFQAAAPESLVGGLRWPLPASLFERSALAAAARLPLPMVPTLSTLEADELQGTARETPPPWTAAVLLLWAIGAAGSMVTIGVGLAELRRRLRGRLDIREGPLPSMLVRLASDTRLRRPPRLTSSEAVSVPMAFGVRRPEICLPPRAQAMDEEHQESLLAHELAHVIRRDPAWQIGMRALEALLFVQPLNRIVRKRLHEIAEFRCDDWAVARTGRPLPLASCLTEVAAWVTESSTLEAAALTRRGSAIGRRVRRLLDDMSPAPGVPDLLWPALLMALAVFAVGAPGFSSAARAAASGELARQPLPASPIAVQVVTLQALPAPRIVPAARHLPTPRGRSAPGVVPTSRARPAPRVVPSARAVPAPRTTPPPDPDEAESSPGELSDEGSDAAKIENGAETYIAALVLPPSERYGAAGVRPANEGDRVRRRSQDVTRSVSAARIDKLRRLGREAVQEATNAAGRLGPLRAELRRVGEEIEQALGETPGPDGLDTRPWDARRRRQILSLADQARRIHEAALPVEKDLRHVFRQSQEDDQDVQQEAEQESEKPCKRRHARKRSGAP